MNIVVQNIQAQVLDTTTRLANSSSSIINEVVERKKNIDNVINTNKPVILLQGNDTIDLAQTIALTNNDFCKHFIDEKSKKKTLSEVFGVYKMLKSNSRFKADANAILYRVEMYNYAYNASSVAVIDITNKKIINVNHYFQTQPDVPKHLGDLALKIAVASAEVKAALKGLALCWNKNFIAKVGPIPATIITFKDLSFTLMEVLELLLEA